MPTLLIWLGKDTYEGSLDLQLSLLPMKLTRVSLKTGLKFCRCTCAYYGKFIIGTFNFVLNHLHFHNSGLTIGK